jgi:2-dehydro-3-deoxyphosphooctonate aldolase (KDO 8-P synthase)
MTLSIPSVQIGSLTWNPLERPLLIAGPCVMESQGLTEEIAGRLREISHQRDVPLVFKASFDKANRTSGSSYRGPGMEDGLRWLDQIRSRWQLPVTTDLHEPQQAAVVAAHVDLLQIPAFLARQTDLLVAAAQTGKPMNVKKGQFMAPGDMRYVVEKVHRTGSGGLMLCERGTFFGYGRLVNDMQSIPLMQGLGVPVIFDATHSVQQPGGLGGATGGNRAMVEPMARAAAAAGANGFFFETHPNPDQSPSDGPNMVPLADFAAVLDRVVAIWETVSRFPA